MGSAGGPPGLIRAAVQPHLRFTLIESTGKKARFLRAAADALGLANVEVLSERAEDLARRDDLRAAFDAVLARAVGRIAVIAELTVPFAKVGGIVLLTKGQRADEELEEARAALHMLHVAVAGVVETPTGRIVAIEKRRVTPHAYPRRAGEAKRAPLGVSNPAKPARGDD
ncbi:MAG: class I SAM-dependent methyltransferase [Phycisphaerales bacterium]|nr:class I SAM-dependent methyltransferase [Phycisphaerales bacterium]